MMNGNQIPPERDPFRGWGAPERPPQPAKKISAAAKALLASLLALLVTVFGSLAVLIADAAVIDPVPPESTASRPSASSHRPTLNENAPSVTLHDPGDPADALTEAEIAEKVRPSVVGIVTYSTYDSESGLDESAVLGEGSGVVLTADGYILTNAHVVEDGERLLVVDANGAYYNAELVGCDTRTDLAVIRVTNRGVQLTPAEFADSAPVRVGDEVLAVGNPGGLSYAGTVTYGRVSAVNRPISTSVNVLGLFQVDAAINPGNSGGALVNQWGQVIGINCAKVVASGYEGIGFAIPMTKAKPVFDSLMKYGYVKDRVKLGVTIKPITTVTAAMNSLPCGMQIVSLLDSNVFARADVQPDDIITAIDGLPMTDTAVMYEQLYAYRPGDKAVFTLYRPSSGVRFDVTVALLSD